MKTQLVLLFLQVAFAAMLMWSCFCRLVKTNAGTYREVRWAILLELIAAGMLLGAPFMPWLMPREVDWAPLSTPMWVWVAMLAAALVMQLVTARYWANGEAPEHFQALGKPSTALAVLAAALVLGGGARMAHAQEPVPFALLKPGQSLTCAAPEGCIAMAGMVFQLMLQAERAEAAKTGCRPNL